MLLDRLLYRKLVAALGFQVEVTSRCNCKCIHCYNYWRRDSNQATCSSDMTFEVANKVVNEIRNNKLFSIVITGGEPFLNFDVARFVADKVLEDDVDVSFNSNLSILNDEEARWLVSNDIPVMTSVMGESSEVHDHIAQSNGAFDGTMGGIKKLLNIGMKPSVNIVITKLNAPHLSNILEMLCKIGISSISVTPAICPEDCDDFSKYSLSNEDIIDSYNILSEYREKYNIHVDTSTNYPLCGLEGVHDIKNFIGRSCTFGRSQLVVASDGSIRECPHSANCIGNIMNEDMTSIWERCQCYCYASFFPKACLECKLFGFCNGGCRIAGKKCFGSMDSMDPKAKPECIDSVFDRLQALERSKENNDISIGNSFVISRYKVRKEINGYMLGVGRRFRSTVFISDEAFYELEKFVVGKEYQVSDVLNSYSKENKNSFLLGMAWRKVLSFK